MSNKKRRRRSSATARTGKGQSKKSRSLAIPIVAGLVAVIVILGAALSLANWQPTAAGLPGSVGGLQPVPTAQALSTQSIPYPEVPRISIEETQTKLQQGQALLVDVRSRAAYDKEHALGAISIPESEVDSRLGDLSPGKDLVLYCT
jgi:hypothetical protein